MRILIPALLFAGFSFTASAAGTFKVPEGAARAVVSLPDGFKVAAELALTEEERSKGLMFRKELREDRGMLFVFEDGGEKNFWMKNTFVELDMIFLDKDLKVKKIFHRVPPMTPGQGEPEVARASAPALCVLELAGGTARRHGLKPGTRLNVYFSPAVKKRSAKAD
jgi:hypothetical protein